MIHRVAASLAVLMIPVALIAAEVTADQIAAIEVRSAVEIDKLVDDTGEIDSKTREKATEMVMKGVEAHENQEFEKAVRSYTRAIELWPTFSFAYYERAFTWSLIGEQLEGFEDACRATLLDPKLEQAHILKATLLDEHVFVSVNATP